MSTKRDDGNFFEDFEVGSELVHAVPRTVTEGDVALYIALTGERFPLHCAETLAKDFGHEQTPLSDLLTFHMVFGKTVNDISLNAVANLGYAECVFHSQVFAGDTLSARSTVIGKKLNSSKKHGVVWVRTAGFNQHGEKVLSYVRWVMVNTRHGDSATNPNSIPDLKTTVPASELPVSSSVDKNSLQRHSGEAFFFDDYDVSERIHHVTGMTIEETEHAMATRLYQNTAKVHFNAHAMKDSRFGQRLMYGGHVISVCRAAMFNGLANGTRILAINAGSHANPTFAGDTVYAFAEVLEKAILSDAYGALRIRLIGVKNLDPSKENIAIKSDVNGKQRYHKSVVLDLDLWLEIPR